MSGPRRIQLRRTKGWRKPDGAIVVARPSKWGNPFKIGEPVGVHGIDVDGLIFEGTARLNAEMAVELFAQDVRARITINPDDMPADRAYAEEWQRGLAELAGHDLACWCPLDRPCHADVLLEIANQP
ncbi:DUF4326 domain-containing protein [uncultured Jatrophihabitans sp.]|uniref:DUF4326 domain-containing protein n=1 Tax=uncultured Jatrophihabitans sp. TaxID=1610747 RepID=UPI0035C9664B